MQISDSEITHFLIAVCHLDEDLADEFTDIGRAFRLMAWKGLAGHMGAAEARSAIHLFAEAHEAQRMRHENPHRDDEITHLYVTGSIDTLRAAA